MIRVMQFVGLGTAAPAGAMLISPHEPLPACIPVTAVHGVQEVPASPVPPVVPNECHRQRHRPDYSPPPECQHDAPPDAPPPLPTQ